MFAWLNGTKAEPVAMKEPSSSFFTTHAIDGMDRHEALGRVKDKLSVLTNPRAKDIHAYTDAAVAMDDNSGWASSLKMSQSGVGISEVLALWYVNQGFIGYQLCALIAQHWLINKCCSMPGRDAIRKGFDVVSVDGDELPDQATKMLNRYDRAFRLKANLEQFVRKGRIFGIRIAIFKVESTDPMYYENPFNPDGITPGSYKGIVQVDPYWTSPMLMGIDASQPDSLHFYEPTFWMINGKRYHRSHLIIFRNAEPTDLLKPQYLYGGIPIPQMIMERVYGAERTANEAPQLAQTKRTNIWLTSMATFKAAGDAAIEAMNKWVFMRDNYSVKMGDKEGDEFQQHDVSLADLDTVIMTQYQLVCSAANVPSTKMLGTTLKGFATGDYEEASYHEELESIQSHDLTPFIERHHLLVNRSYIAPTVPGMLAVETTVNWRPLDSPTAQELAQTNLVKAQTGVQLVTAGAIDSQDERDRIARDPESGYHDLGIGPVEEPDDEDEI